MLDRTLSASSTSTADACPCLPLPLHLPQISDGVLQQCKQQIAASELVLATIGNDEATLKEVSMAFDVGTPILLIFDNVSQEQRGKLGPCAQMSWDSIMSTGKAAAWNKAQYAFKTVPYVRERLGSLESYIKAMEGMANGDKV
jgi:hypothetical protein